MGRESPSVWERRKMHCGVLRSMSLSQIFAIPVKLLATLINSVRSSSEGGPGGVAIRSSSEGRPGGVAAGVALERWITELSLVVLEAMAQHGGRTRRGRMKNKNL